MNAFVQLRPPACVPHTRRRGAGAAAGGKEDGSHFVSPLGSLLAKEILSPFSYWIWKLQQFRR